MDVIGHEDISVNAAATALCSFREPPSVLDVVVFAEEDRTAIVAALDDVERLIGQEGATQSGHGASSVGNGAGKPTERPGVAQEILL
jgi:hypothetical protein